MNLTRRKCIQLLTTSAATLGLGGSSKGDVPPLVETVQKLWDGLDGKKIRLSREDIERELSLYGEPIEDRLQTDYTQPQDPNLIYITSRPFLGDLAGEWNKETNTMYLSEFSRADAVLAWTSIGDGISSVEQYISLRDTLEQNGLNLGSRSREELTELKEALQSSGFFTYLRDLTFHHEFGGHALLFDKDELGRGGLGLLYSQGYKGSSYEDIARMILDEMDGDRKKMYLDVFMIQHEVKLPVILSFYESIDEFLQAIEDTPLNVTPRAFEMLENRGKLSDEELCNKYGVSAEDFSLIIRNNALDEVRYHFFNEIFARKVNVLMTLYIGPNKRDVFTLTDEELDMFAGMGYKEEPIFRKAVEKYRLALYAEKNGILVTQEALEILRYANEFSLPKSLKTRMQNDRDIPDYFRDGNEEIIEHYDWKPLKIGIKSTK